MSKLWRLAPLLVLLVLLACVWNAPASQLRELNQHRTGSDTATDKAATSIAQSFRSDRDGLSRIEIQLKSFPGPLPTDGVFRLRAGDGLTGTVLRSVPFTASDFSRNPYLGFSFDPIDNSAGQTYTFVLSSPATALATSFTAHMTPFDSYSAGNTYLDSDATPGDLTFSAYYTYTPANMLAGIWSAIALNIAPLLLWPIFLLLPGLALAGVLWPRLGGAALLAAPGLTLLAWPILLLLTGSLGIHRGPLLVAIFVWLGMFGVLLWRRVSAWLIAAVLSFLAVPVFGNLYDLIGGAGTILAMIAGLLALCVWLAVVYPASRKSRTQNDLTPQTTLPVRKSAAKTERLGWAYWAMLGAILLLTLFFRLTPLRDLVAGMGLDAYHHTLVIEMFLYNGGLPTNYLPFAPLQSFTYHFGFHAFAAALDWWATGSPPVEQMMMLAGQLAGTLPVVTLALFGWRVLGDRRLGLIAGALAGLVAIFPAFYINWSRYTQSLGLALLPVAWVTLFDALGPYFAPGPTPTLRQRWPALVLAGVACAGLFVTHYRIFAMFASYAALVIGGRLIALWWRNRRSAKSFAPIPALALTGAVTLVLLAPWLLNLRANFTTRFAGSADASNAGYYDLNSMIGAAPRDFWSTTPLIALAGLGLAWCIIGRKWAGVALGAWFGLHLLWGNPTAFPFKLPGSGYVDSVTVVTSAFVPLTLLAAYPLLGAFRLVQMLPRLLREERRPRWWRPATGAIFGAAAIVALALAGNALLPILDTKPYVSAADMAGMNWLRANTPANALVLGSGFGQSWGPEAVQGSDASLWTPVLADRASTLPPVPAYNERPVQPDYLAHAVDVVRYSYDLMRDGVSAETKQNAWAALRADGISYIFVGSRGGVLDPARLMSYTDQVEQVFHQDGVWIFRLR